MTAKEVYLKTMQFNWLKLLLGIINVLVCALLLAVLGGIGALFGEIGAIIGILIAMGGTRAVNLIIMHYFGYMIKAGHVAIITQAVTTGQVPAEQVETAKQMVAERFLTSNIYFAVDKLVDGAVRQLQNVLTKAGNMLDFIPGAEAVMNIGKMFVGIALGYVDECCLGYTFLHKEQGAFKSACDGVVIYAQNWKQLLKDAAITTAVVIGSVVGVTLVVFVIIGGLFTLFGGNKLIAFLLALLIALAIKFAFIDSWILVKMMTSYMQAAPSTVITFDLYGKLCGVSSKFKELYEKGKSEPQPTMAAAPAGAGYAPAAPHQIPAATVPAPAPAASTRFCGNCGTKIEPGVKFCGGCGKSV